MIRMFMFVIAMVSFVGCASQEDVHSIQKQLDVHVVSYTKNEKAQEERDLKQDTEIAELYSKIDRVFAKR